MKNKWTKQPPVEPGYYIVANKGYATEICKVVYEVICREKMLVVYFHGEERPLIPNSQSVDLWWSEPVKFPEEPEW